MPKMKTHKGTAKRVKTTGKGKYKRSRAYTNHLRTKKSGKRKRHLRKSTLVSSADKKKMKVLLPYS
jgi:large subunit ribosomal protein L35